MPSNQFYESFVDKAVDVLNKADVSMKDVPESVRVEMLNLEALMVIAKTKGDVIKYMAVVTKWRDLLLAYKPNKPIEEFHEKEKEPWQKQQQEMKQLNLLM
jgi:hypothetical protein